MRKNAVEGRRFAGRFRATFARSVLPRPGAAFGRPGRGQGTRRADLLRSGLDYWRERSDFFIVEGAGGLMSPMGDDEYVADLAHDFGYPLIVVAQNQIGVINQTLQTMIVAMTFRDGLDIAGIVLNRAAPARRRSQFGDNREQLEMRSVPPVLAEVEFGQSEFQPPVDWRWRRALALAGGRVLARR